MKKLIFISPEQYGYLSDHYYLAQYAKKEYDLTFICFDKGLKKLNADGINLIYVDFGVGKIKRSIDYIKKVINLCKKERFDIVFCVDSKITLPIALLVKAPLKIFDIRTSSISMSGLKRWVNNFRTKITTFFFDRVAVISAPLITTLSLTKSKCSVLPLGAIAIDNSSKVYNKLHLIYVGTFYLRHIEKTVEGIALYLKNRTDTFSVQYDIIGFGSEEDEAKIKESIIKNNLNHIVTFHGRKTHAELQPFFKEATIGVCFVPQTQFYDAQPPTKLFEYAMSGLINIATNTSENRKLITSVNGVVCEDDEQSFSMALMHIASNIDKYIDVEIRKSVAEFSWENIFNTKMQPILVAN